jgi:hypothetical protein
MESIRNDVDDYFDGFTNEFATFEMPSYERNIDWSDNASVRIGTLWRRLGVGAAFARWDSSPDRERVLEAARSDPSALREQTSRLVWEALAAIITRDAFDEVPLIDDGEAAAHLANELRSRLLTDKAGTLAAIVPPWSTGYSLNPVTKKSSEPNARKVAPAAPATPSLLIT